MSMTVTLFLLTLVAFGVWIATIGGALAVALYLLALTVVSFVLEVVAELRSSQNDTGAK